MKEEWRKVTVCSNYEVSNLGRVKSLLRNKYRILKPYRRGKDYNDGNGNYLAVRLTLDDKTSKDFAVHRLVALSFLPNPYNLPQINHKNGIRDDNRLDNLEWCDTSFNIWHSYHVLKKGEYGIEVSQYTKEGEFIRTYKNISEAGRITSTNASSISSVCKRDRKSAGGFIWRYSKDYLEHTFISDREKKVVMIGKDGVIKKVYDSVIEAANELKIKSPSNISGCCNKKKGYNYAGGFMWRYLDDYKDDFEPYVNATIICTTTSDLFVKEYHGTKEILSDGFDVKKVIDCVRGITYSSFKYKWKLKNNDKKLFREQRRSKHILQYDLNNNFIKEWESVKSACDFLGCYSSNMISKIHKDGIYKGYKWFYKEELMKKYNLVEKIE